MLHEERFQITLPCICLNNRISLTDVHMVRAREHAGHSVELCDSGHVSAVRGPQVPV